MRSTYVWLDAQMVRESGEYTQQEVPPQKNLGGYTKHMLRGIQIVCDSGNFSFQFSSEGVKLPAELRELVTSVTVQEYIPAESRREAGIYERDGATAKLALASRNMCNVPITAVADGVDGIEKAHALIDAILAGELRPTRSFEGAQTGLSRAELEARAARYEREHAVRTQMLVDYIAELNRRGVGFRGGFRRGIFSGVASRLQSILDHVPGRFD